MGVSVAWTTPENLREYRFVFVIVFVRSLGISNFVLTACLSGVRPDLSPEDNVIAQELAECSPRPYSELIRSDIPGPSCLRSTRSAALRPSPPSATKFSPIGPSTAKPVKGELLARVETLPWKSGSVKRKTSDSVEEDHPAWGKVPKLGASSSSPSTHVRVSRQVLSAPAEVPKALSSRPRSGSTAKEKYSSGRAVERPLEVMPLTVWNPLRRVLSHPPRGRKS